MNIQKRTYVFNDVTRRQKDMMIINGLLVLTLILLAGLAYLIFDGIQRAELEAHLELIHIAHQSRAGRQAQMEYVIDNCHNSMTTERSDLSGNDRFGRDHQGFFSISYDSLSVGGQTFIQTNNSLQFISIENTDGVCSSSAATTESGSEDSSVCWTMDARCA
jgi:hypothetical protein